MTTSIDPDPAPDPALDASGGEWPSAADIRAALLARAQAYCDRAGIKLYRLGQQISGNFNLFYGLAEGGDLKLTTYDKYMKALRRLEAELLEDELPPADASAPPTQEKPHAKRQRHRGKGKALPGPDRKPRKRKADPEGRLQGGVRAAQ